MKRLLIGAASAALLIPATALAHDPSDGACVDAGCTTTMISEGPEIGPNGYEGIESPSYGEWGFDASGQDTTISPGDDFFQYANGGYVEDLVIPADRTRYGSFDLLSQLSENRLKALVEGFSGDASLAAGTDEAKIRDLYNSYMDEAAVEALDAQPLEPILAGIREIADHDAMAAYMGSTMGAPGDSIWGTGIGDDAKNPEANTVYLSQSGLGLPNRDYYLEARFADKKTAYQAYIAQMLGMVGWENAEQAAADIVAMESKIAEAHWTRAESRDRDKTYNPMTAAELTAQAPGFDWVAYLDAAQVSGQETFVVSQNTAFPTIAAIYADTPIETLRAWQAFNVVDSAAPYLSKRFSDAQWTFRSKELSGQLEQRPREKRAVAFANQRLPEAMGRAYVARWFPPEHKAQVQGSIWTTEREWWDFMSYWPKLPPLRVRVYRDEDYIKSMSDEIDRFNDELAALVNRIRCYQEPPRAVGTPPNGTPRPELNDGPAPGQPPVQAVVAEGHHARVGTPAALDGGDLRPHGGEPHAAKIGHGIGTPFVPLAF